MDHNLTTEVQAPKGHGIPTTRGARPRAQAILKATAKLIAARGVAETTVSEVGRAMGMRKSVVHYYFENKQALVSAVQNLAETKLIGQIQAALRKREGAPLELSAFLRPLREVARGEDDDFAMRLQFWAESRREEQIRSAVVASRARVRASLEQALTEIHLSEISAGEYDPKVIAGLLLAITDGLAISELLDGEQAQEQAYALFLSLLELGVSEARISAEQPASVTRSAITA